MDEHVLAVLRAKRTESAGQVHDTEKKLAKLRGALANLDASLFADGFLFDRLAPAPKLAWGQTEGRILGATPG